ncbi:MAG: alpha/beta hydrolase, partial [Mesorhizobium sp.]
MKILLAGLAIIAATFGNALAQPDKPTIVLVHGAFADSSSWNGV